MRRVLLDEGVPRQLALALQSQGVEAVAFSNEWKQLSNGALLDRIERERFDTLVTCDKNMPSQQNLAGRSIAILVLATNRRDAVLSQAARIAEILPSLEACRFTDLSTAGQISICERGV